MTEVTLNILMIYVKYNVRHICMILYDSGKSMTSEVICVILNIFYAIIKLIDNNYQVTETCLEVW